MLRFECKIADDKDSLDISQTYSVDYLISTLISRTKDRIDSSKGD